MDFILEIPGNLSPEVCEDMIKRFENDDRKVRGLTADLNPDSAIKRSMDLAVSSFDEWKDIDEYLHKQLNEGIDKYKEHIRKKCGTTSWMKYSLEDSGYQIQKTTRGEYYSWHDDGMLRTKRIFTFLWYLNTLDPLEHGGGTAFHPSIAGGKIIKPEQGKLLLFPATWTYIHSGMPVATKNKDKYICTGWIHAPDAI